MSNPPRPLIPQGLSIILFICVMCSAFSHSDRGNFLGFVSMAGFWTSAILLFFYIINAVAFMTNVPWVKVVSLFFFSFLLFFYIINAVAFMTNVPWVKVVSLSTCRGSKW